MQVVAYMTWRAMDDAAKRPSLAPKPITNSRGPSPAMGSGASGPSPAVNASEEEDEEAQAGKASAGGADLAALSEQPQLLFDCSDELGYGFTGTVLGGL